MTAQIYDGKSEPKTTQRMKKYEKLFQRMKKVSTKQPVSSEFNENQKENKTSDQGFDETEYSLY